MYMINKTWTSFDIDLKTLKQDYLNSSSMIDNAIKKYLQNAFNKANIGSVSGEILNIERYFKLPFIGMYSKVTQNKIEKHCKNFAKMPKFDLFSLVINCVRHLSTRILFHMFSVQR